MFVIARSTCDEAIQSYLLPWIASRSLSSGGHSPDPLARNDDGGLRFANPPYDSTSLTSSLGRYLVERHVLVDPDIAGQSEHPLGDDVAHDLVGAAFDPGAGRAQQHGLEFSGDLGVLGSAEHAGGALQIERVGRDVLHHRPRHQLADGIFRTRPLAFR